MMAAAAAESRPEVGSSRMSTYKIRKQSSETFLHNITYIYIPIYNLSEFVLRVS